MSKLTNQRLIAVLLSLVLVVGMYTPVIAAGDDYSVAFTGLTDIVELEGNEPPGEPGENEPPGEPNDNELPDEPNGNEPPIDFGENEPPGEPDDSELPFEPDNTGYPESNNLPAYTDALDITPVLPDPPDDSPDLSELSFLPDRVVVKMASTGGIQQFSTTQPGLPDLGVALAESRLINPSADANTGDGFSLNAVTSTSDQSHNNIFVLVLEETGVEAVENALAILNAHPLVEIAEPDFLYEFIKAPNDTFYLSYQKVVLDRINAESAWDINTGNNSIVVGIVDSGIAGTHPDLVDNLWVNPNPGLGGYVNDINGYNFTGGSQGGTPVGGTPTDNDGHGTHVAGIVGAKGNNGIGVAGVNWDVSLAWMGIGIGNGYLSNSAAIEATNYANLHNIPITNNSYGGSSYSQIFEDTIRNYNGLFVAAAGNGDRSGNGVNNDTTPMYPAGYNLPNVISVAATDNSDTLTRFSNFGAKSVHIAAPGSRIPSTYIGNQYVLLDGTSMASPMVAGVAALVLAEADKWGRTLSPDELRTILLDSARPVAALSNRTVTGGVVDAYAALQLIQPQPNSISISRAGTHVFTGATFGYSAQAPMSVTITNVGTGATGSLTVALSGTNANRFTLSASSIPSIDTTFDTANFNIVPVNGLNAGTYTATVTVSGTQITTPRSFSVSFIVSKSAGAAIGGAPTVSGAPTQSSITVNPVSVPANPGNQTVEYGISTSATLVPSSWQSGRAFNGLLSSTYYYIWARTAENSNFFAGNPVRGAAIRTAGIFVPPPPPLPPPDPPLPPPDPNSPFRDVPTNFVAFPAIKWANDNGIVTGANGMFLPNDQMTRAQYAFVLWRYSGRPPANTSARFSDVPATHVASAAIAWANENGIVTGAGNRFMPEAEMTRAQMVLMMYRYSRMNNKDLSSNSNALDRFSDRGEIVPAAQEAMRWAVTHGLITGNAGRLTPNDTITRAQVVLILYRYVNGIGA